MFPADPQADPKQQHLAVGSVGTCESDHSGLCREVGTTPSSKTQATLPHKTPCSSRFCVSPQQDPVTGDRGDSDFRAAPVRPWTFTNTLLASDLRPIQYPSGRSEQERKEQTLLSLEVAMRENWGPSFPGSQACKFPVFSL